VILSAALRQAEQKLAAESIDSPALDARLLVEHALGLDRTALFSQSQRLLTETESQNIDTLISRRAAHEPVARIIGMREFWSLPFGINEATLEPRPDSETLVETVLKLLRQVDEVGNGGVSPPLAGGMKGGLIDTGDLLTNPPPSPPVRLRQEASARPDANRVEAQRRRASGRGAETIHLLDLGTGTGCLLLSLLHELPNASGMGIDFAPRAVEQARENATRLDLTQRVTFKTGNWLDNITGTFDVILSNPPYIPAAEIPSLMPEVREHDPIAALDGGDDGLDVYRHLIPRLRPFLNPKGFVIFEVGQGQADAVAALCSTNGFTNVSKYRDFNQIERCVTAFNPS